MKKHNGHPLTTNDFERTAQELVSMGIALSERRIRENPQGSPAAKALAAAALNIQASLDVFVKITQLTE